MAKQAGMGDGLLLDGFDISGDTSNVTLGAALNTQDVTPISAYGNARLGLAHDGNINFGSFWNPSSAGAGTSAHEVLRTLPRTDRIATYLRSTVLGAPAASLVTEQIDYAAARNADGSLLFTIDAQSNGYGMEWGNQLTAGLRTEAAAGNAPSVDLGAGPPVSYSFGWAAYLQVSALTGTSVTVKVQDSADNATWADLTGAVFAAATGRGAQRIFSASPTATVRRYVRVVTSGTYTSAVYAVNFVRYEAVGHA